MRRSSAAGLLAVLLLSGCHHCSTAPRHDVKYEEWVCKTAGMTLLKGTHTCMGPDSTFINLQPLPAEWSD